MAAEVSLKPTRRVMLAGGAAVAVAVAASFRSQRVLATEEILKRTIPSSGETLPAVGLGTGATLRSDTAEVRAGLAGVLKSLVAAGASVVDTASSYGAAEDIIGALVAAEGLRPKLFLATKMEATEPVTGATELKRSLERLKVPRVDLVQLHNVSDPNQSFAMFRDFKREGLTRYYGVTSTRPHDYPAMETVVTREKPEFMEVGYSIADRQAEDRLLPAAAAAGAAVLAAQPVGGSHDPLFRLVKGKPLPAMAKDIGAETWAQFFLKFVLSHPAVTVAIPGTISAAHMTDDLGALRGRLPDAAERKAMIAAFDAVR